MCSWVSVRSWLDLEHVRARRPPFGEHRSQRSRPVGHAEAQGEVAAGGGHAVLDHLGSRTGSMLPPETDRDHRRREGRRIGQHARRRRPPRPARRRASPARGRTAAPGRGPPRSPCAPRRPAGRSARGCSSTGRGHRDAVGHRRHARAAPRAGRRPRSRGTRRRPRPGRRPPGHPDGGAFTAAATPPSSPPPPALTTTAATSGHCSRSSRPTVPWPAITSGCSKGWMNTAPVRSACSARGHERLVAGLPDAAGPAPRRRGWPPAWAAVRTPA